MKNRKENNNNRKRELAICKFPFSVVNVPFFQLLMFPFSVLFDFLIS